MKFKRKRHIKGKIAIKRFLEEMIRLYQIAKIKGQVNYRLS